MPFAGLSRDCIVDSSSEVYILEDFGPQPVNQSLYTEMKWEFKENHTFDERQGEAKKIREKYPDRIPVIVEKVPRSTIPDIDKKKFLVPADLSVAQFMYIVRRRISLPSEKAMFLFVNKVLPTTSASMGTIYSENRDEDGFLYVAYSGENTFGSHS